MDDLISKLSEIRSKYNCFDEDEEPYYRALSETIKILSKRADGDTISRQDAINAVLDMNVEHRVSWMDAIIDIIDELPSAQPESPAEAQEILQYLDECLYPLISTDHYEVYSELHDMISALPEIIHCQNCKYADSEVWLYGNGEAESYGVCALRNERIFVDDFCSRAKRKDNGIYF